jgi:hypothetical protein
MSAADARDRDFKEKVDEAFLGDEYTRRAMSRELAPSGTLCACEDRSPVRD